MAVVVARSLGRLLLFSKRRHDERSCRIDLSSSKTSTRGEKRVHSLRLNGGTLRVKKYDVTSKKKIHSD
jgi:hypothetical protein